MCSFRLLTLAVGITQRLVAVDNQATDFLCTLSYDWYVIVCTRESLMQQADDIWEHDESTFSQKVSKTGGQNK